MVVVSPSVASSILPAIIKSPPCVLIVVALELVMCVLESKLRPSVVDVMMLKLPFKTMALAVNEIAPAAEIPAILLTVPIVRVALLVSVNEVMPEAAIVLSVFKVLLNV